MTERKPIDASWESWIERQIVDGQRHGAFDGLDGHGRPIDDIGVVRDEMWWVKSKLRDEEINYLPPTIAIRAERDAAVDAAMAAPTEEQARAVLEQLNQQIRYVNSHATAGPPSSVMTVDVETMIERWQAGRVSPEVARVDEPAPETPPAPRRRWWHRVRRRPQLVDGDDSAHR